MDIGMDRRGGGEIWLDVLAAPGRAEPGQVAAADPSVGTGRSGIIEALWIWAAGPLQGLLRLPQQQRVLVSVRDKGGSRAGRWA